MTDIEAGSAVRISLWVATATVVVSTPPALALGWVLARRQFRAKPIVSALLLAPMVLPPVVTGLLLLQAFGRRSWIGGWLADLGLPLSFSAAGAVLAAVVVSFPMYVLVARAAFAAVDPRYEDVAMTLGDTRFRAFFRVALPLAGPGLAAGAVLTFARALGEFGATVVLAGNMEGETRTIALAVYSLLDVPSGEDQASTLVIISLSLSVAALIGYEWLVRRQHLRLER